MDLEQRIEWLRSELKRLEIKEQDVINKRNKLNLEVELIDALYYRQCRDTDVYKLRNEFQRERNDYDCNLII